LEAAPLYADGAAALLGAVLPRRKQQNPGKVRPELATLREMLTARQIALLDRHQRLIEDFIHVLQVYIAPDAILDLSGFPAIERETHVARLRRTALSLLLPTERDTLSSAIKTLTGAVAATVQLQRTVAGVTTARAHEDEGGKRLDLSKLGTPALVQIHEAMQLLRGDCERCSPPPVPAVAEPIEGLRVPLDAPS
jgi:hypothetical protein